MKIVIAVTNVIDLTQPYKIPIENHTPHDYTPILNPWDEFSLEAALHIKEKYSAELIALSTGDEMAESALRKALAMGCDSAIRVETGINPQESGFIAAILAAAIQKIGAVEMAFCGRQSIDFENGSVAGMLAQFLGWPYLAQITTIESLYPSKIIARRTVANQLYTISAQFPLVLTASKEFGEPRFPSFMGTRKAAKASIEIWSAADLGIERNQINQVESRLERVSAEPFQREMITAENEAKTAEILNQKVNLVLP